MKMVLLMSVMILAIGCGKVEQKKKTQTFSLSQLEAMGVKLITPQNIAGVKAAILCTDTQHTNEQRLVELRNFKNSLNTGGTFGNFTTTSGVSLSPYELDNLFQNAISTLQYSQTSATTCPKTVLSMI